jgi:hypothetical protein
LAPHVQNDDIQAAVEQSLQLFRRDAWHLGHLGRYGFLSSSR